MSPKTVEFHVSAVYRKLDVTNRTALSRKHTERVSSVARASPRHQRARRDTGTPPRLDLSGQSASPPVRRTASRFTRATVLLYVAAHSWNHVVVREGRGRQDPALGSEDGEVLMEFEADRLYGRCDRLTLPDGSEVEIVGARWDTSGQTTQTLYVGNVK